MIKATVYVTIKEGVLDPHGKAAQEALRTKGYDHLRDIRIGKYIEIKLDTTDLATAEQEVKAMCEELLTNPVVEDFRYELEVVTP